MSETIRHVGECATDRYARDVCEGSYLEKVNDVIELSVALRGVLSLCGENAEILRVAEAALRDHGIAEEATAAAARGSDVHVLGQLVRASSTSRIQEITGWTYREAMALCVRFGMYQSEVKQK